MLDYTEEQLLERDKIIQSQKLFWEFLDTNIINKLVNLFDNDSNNSNVKITKYIEDERKLQGLDNSGVSIVSYVYGYNNKNPTIILIVKKNNKDFVHISFHLSPKSLNPKNNGLIHMVKNVYKTPKNKKIKNRLYTLIHIKQYINKPRSLIFSIGNGYKTEIDNANLYDRELQKEMDVIITVLNRLFDEDNRDFYIGDENKLFSIHKHIDTILQNINNETKYVSIKNKGVRMLPPLNSNQLHIINDRHVKKTPKRKNHTKMTRKTKKFN